MDGAHLHAAAEALLRDKENCFVLKLVVECFLRFPVTRGLSSLITITIDWPTNVR